MPTLIFLLASILGLLRGSKVSEAPGAPVTGLLPVDRLCEHQSAGEPLAPPPRPALTLLPSILARHAHVNMGPPCFRPPHVYGVPSSYLECEPCRIFFVGSSTSRFFRSPRDHRMLFACRTKQVFILRSPAMSKTFYRVEFHYQYSVRVIWSTVVEETDASLRRLPVD